MTEPPAAIHVHVHYAMAGTFPLRVANVLFTDRRVLVPEYAYLTPLFGIAMGGGKTAAESARHAFATRGVAGLLDTAEAVRDIPYGDLTGVRVYDPPWLGRPKIALDTRTGPPYAYRIHASVDPKSLAEALSGLSSRRGFDVSYERSLGLHPLASLRRFRADR